MMDDIDIEDHELIDNPQVRDVFPNIEEIKQEILEFGVSVPPIQKPEREEVKGQDDVIIGHVTGTLMPKPHHVVVKKEPLRLRDRMVFLDDDCIDGDDDVDIKPEVPSVQESEDSELCTNKIILGNKKLNNMSNICETCEVNFDSKSKLDEHNKTKHKSVDNKVIVGTKRSLKSAFNDKCNSESDFESSIILKNSKDSGRSNHHSCFHCDKIFNTKQEVVDHLYGVIKHKQNTKKGDSKNVTDSKINEYIKTDKGSKNKRKIDSKSDVESQLTNKISKNDTKRHKAGPKSKTKNTNKYNLIKCSVVIETLSKDSIKAYLNRNKEDHSDAEEIGFIGSDESDYEANITDEDKEFQPDNDSSSGDDDEDDEAILLENDRKELQLDNETTQIADAQSETSKKDKKYKTKAYNKCILCSCYFDFKNKIDLDEHMRHVHSIKTPQNKKTSSSLFNPYCDFCDVKLKNITQYNEHVIKNKTTHTNKMYDLNEFNYYIYKCLICEEEFSSRYHLYKHKDHKHMNCNRGFWSDFLKDKAYFDKIRIKDYPEKFACVQAAYGDIINPPIPKDTLFKCSVCSCHFINAKGARIHYTKCIKNTAESNRYNCDKCHLLIHSIIKRLHAKQHEVTDEFKVYVVDENSGKLADQILCVCPKCGVYYSEGQFWKHYDKCGDNLPESKYCVQCDILVDTTCKRSHEDRHKVVNEFVVMEYMENEDEDINDEETNEGRDKVIRKSAFLLYYCKNCKSFVRKTGSHHFSTHSENRCKKLPKKLCQLCGLIITQRAYITHKQQHKWRDDLKLLDYTFYDFFTNKCIDPPFPHFPNCKNCNTHFEDVNIILKHNCEKIDAIKCDICDRNFTPNAHKVHMYYHEYRHKKKNRLKLFSKTGYLRKVKKNGKELTVRHLNYYPKITKLGEEQNKLSKRKKDVTSHVLYRCITCEIVLDKSKALFHKNSTEDCDTLANKYIKCTKCELKLSNKDFADHTDKHNSDPTFVKDNITLKDFNKDIDSDIEISGESVYESDDSITDKKYKLYQCISCKNCFSALSEVNEHACSSNSKQCMYCRLHFPLQSIKKHVAKHERLDDMTKDNIQLILFDVKKKDKFDVKLHYMTRQLYISDSDDDLTMEIEDNVSKGVDEDVTKSVDEYVTKGVDRNVTNLDENVTNVDNNVPKDTSENISNDNSQEHIETNSNREEDTIEIISEDTQMLDADNSLKYRLFQCKTCHLNFSERKNADHHICSTNESWNECWLCSYLFNDIEYTIHMEYHNFDKDMTENILVKYFNAKRKDEFVKKDQNKVDDVEIVENKTEDSVVIINEEDKRDNGSKEDLNEGSYQKDNVDMQKSNSKDKTEVNRNIIDSNTELRTTQTKEENDTKPIKSKVNIYKCDCSLHFLDFDEASKHNFECKTVRISKQLCTKCKLTFKPSDLFTHIVEHHGKNAHLFCINVIKLTDVKVTDVIFKCDACLLLFAAKTLLFRHHKTCKDNGIQKVSCNNCGLDFHHTSYPLHRTKHHSNGVDLTADQFKIEVVTKKEIPKSYYYHKK